jgi:predicted RNA methylase
MSDHARQKVDYPREPRDLYRTPAWVTEVLLANIEVPERLWEPACGRLDMAIPLAKGTHSVVASDIAPSPEWGPFRAQWPYVCLVEKRDFYTVDFKEAHTRFPRSIVTNPPYSSRTGKPDAGTDFVRHALSLQPRFAAFLLSWDFDAASGRFDLFGADAPVSFFGKLALPKRINWIGFGSGGPRQLHAWYIWRDDQPLEQEHKSPSPPRCLYPSEKVNVDVNEPAFV